MRSGLSAESDIGGVLITEDSLDRSGEQKKLPAAGRSWIDIKTDLLERKSEDYDWRGGRIPIYVYHDNDELLSVSREAYALFFSENALGRRAFPSVATMEQEIIQMSLDLFGAPAVASGSFTSGGTESIFLALKTARDHFRSRRGSGIRPNIVLPRTAHPAFDKASHYLGIEVIRTGLTEELRADINAMRDEVNDDTMMIVGSAPCYPYGVYDPIEALAEFSSERKLWLHVDACLGGFLAPFAKEEGYEIPAFDFSVPGVTSLSADVHKYGFSAKGASVLLYRDAWMKKHQVFHFDAWPRGEYSTETFLGTRPAGSVASAWAVMQYLGRAGYRRLASKTMAAKRRLVQGIEAIAGLEVLRPSELSIVLYRSTHKHIDINAVADLLSEQGWFVGRSREPRAVHLALNAVHAPIIDKYLSTLEAAVHSARRSRRKGTIDDATY